MILTLFNFEGDNLGYTDKVISSYEDLKFNGIGTGEFHLDKDDPLYPIVSQNKHLILEENSFQYIVTGVSIDEDFVIYCRSLNWLLSKAVISPVSLSGTLAQVTSGMLSASYGGDIALGSCPETEDSFSFSCESAMVFSEVIKNLLAPAYLGHTLRFSHEDNCFYLDIIKGNFLDFYVCEGDETLDTITLSGDILDYANSLCYRCAIPVLGGWDPSLNSPTLTSGNEKNLGKCYRVTTDYSSVKRFDLTFYDGNYIYCDTLDGKWKRSTSPPEDFYVYIPDATVGKKYQWFHLSRENSPADATMDLSNQTTNSAFKAAAKNIEFLTDYSLGDLVNLQYVQMGDRKTHLCQVTQVTLSRDSFNNNENPTLEEVK